MAVQKNVKYFLTVLRFSYLFTKSLNKINVDNESKSIIWQYLIPGGIEKEEWWMFQLTGDLQINLREMLKQAHGIGWETCEIWF